jgi:hypothetical protein
MKNDFGFPSFYLHQLNAFLILIALYFLYTIFSVIKKIEPYKIIILLFSLAVGIHGISHLGAEYIYGYNPIRNFLLV